MDLDKCYIFCNASCVKFLLVVTDTGYMDVHLATICLIAAFPIRIVAELRELSLNRLVHPTAHIPLPNRDKTIAPLSSQLSLITLLRAKMNYRCKEGKLWR